MFMHTCTWASLAALVVKNLPTNAGDIQNSGWSLGWEDLLEEGMATHSSILAWRIPWTEEPVGLQPIWSQSWIQLTWLGMMHGTNLHMNVHGSFICNKPKLEPLCFFFLQTHMNLVGIFSHSCCQDQFLPFYLSLRVYNLFSIFTNSHFDIVSEGGWDKHIWSMHYVSNCLKFSSRVVTFG